MSRLEPVLVGLFSASWLVGLACAFDLVPGRPELALTYYALFGTAALLGWLAGNVYVRRAQARPRIWRRLLLVTYLCGPPGIVYFLWALGPAQARLAAPLIPLYSFLVFGIFFLVPVLLRPRPAGS
jgi:hypothetical protein